MPALTAFVEGPVFDILAQPQPVSGRRLLCGFGSACPLPRKGGGRGDGGQPWCKQSAWRKWLNFLILAVFLVPR